MRTVLNILNFVLGGFATTLAWLLATLVSVVLIFTKGFFGTNGITRREGFTTPDTSEAIVKSTAMKQCKDVYILTDKSKFGEVSSVTFGGVTDGKILTEEIPEEYQDSKNILKVE